LRVNKPEIGLSQCQEGNFRNQSQRPTRNCHGEARSTFVVSVCVWYNCRQGY
jgi:hypothetical protein